MRFKNFEIRSSGADAYGDKDPTLYELVKWYKPEHCYVVAWLRWDSKEPCWDLQSVGLRLVHDWVEGLDKWILAWCDMATVCMEDDEDE